MAEAEARTDRYITWPAQALSYKIGEMKIRQLRRQAGQQPGAKFDIRAFHDHILSSGRWYSLIGSVQRADNIAPA